MNSRNKGAEGERELARILREYGYNTRRGQQYCGANGDADVVGLPGIHIECKRVERLNISDAMAQSIGDAKPGEMPAVFHRKNGDPWKVTMLLDDWIKLYRGQSKWLCKERLTEKTRDGILVKECYEEGALRTLYACYGAKPDLHYGNCDEGYCAVEKLVEYEDLEEQGKLLKLPCMVGDMVYAHCSEFGILTYTVDCIVINENVTFQCSSYSEIECLDQIEPNILEFGKTVFLTKEEAEIALKSIN